MFNYQRVGLWFLTKSLLLKMAIEWFIYLVKICIYMLTSQTICMVAIVFWIIYHDVPRKKMYTRINMVILFDSYVHVYQ